MSFFKVMLGLFLVVFIPTFLRTYFAFNSTLVTHCGIVLKKETKNQGSARRGFTPYDYVFVQFENKSTQHFLVNDTDINYKLLSKHWKKNRKVFQSLKQDDRICVTYSISYKQGDILSYYDDVPFLIKINRI